MSLLYRFYFLSPSPRFRRAFGLLVFSFACLFFFLFWVLLACRPFFFLARRPTCLSSGTEGDSFTPGARGLPRKDERTSRTTASGANETSQARVRAGDRPAGVEPRRSRKSCHPCDSSLLARIFFFRVMYVRVCVRTCMPRFFSFFILAMNIYSVPCLDDSVDPPRGRSSTLRNRVHRTLNSQH